MAWRRISRATVAKGGCWTGPTDARRRADPRREIKRVQSLTNSHEWKGFDYEQDAETVDFDGPGRMCHGSRVRTGNKRVFPPWLGDQIQGDGGGGRRVAAGHPGRLPPTPPAWPSLATAWTWAWPSSVLPRVATRRTMTSRPRVGFQPVPLSPLGSTTAAATGFWSRALATTARSIAEAPSASASMAMAGMNTEYEDRPPFENFAAYPNQLAVQRPFLSPRRYLCQPKWTSCFR